ncbi:hypothetical protein VNO80_06243 [Phaseolus coccineus]|uniref:Protein kinase domain-containing protein n=1 Tax=Phaseolus coccineus TaxID=3886 RepID=A0AAN9NGJ3_PHACN
METKKLQLRFSLGRQSSLAPERDGAEDVAEALDPTVRLMYLANEGDLVGIEELLDAGSDVSFTDIDGRTALHVAACQGRTDVVDLLVRRGADPLADAMYYKNHDIVKLLEKHGAKPPITPMHVENAREVPEYEIDPSELDFTNSFCITKVVVKTLGEEVFTDDDKVKAFHDELTLLEKIRHPNVVQFLGAVTHSTPNDDRHRISTPDNRNILRDDSGHLKVADFGVSKLLKFTKTVKEDKPVTRQASIHHVGRYVAPEVYRNEEYDTKVDVFSFALILQEMIEGCPPFYAKPENKVPKAYVENEQPPFTALPKLYAHGLKQLIEECWDEKPHKRPTFRQIIGSLEEINNHLIQKRRWKIGAPGCIQYLEALFMGNRTSPKPDPSSIYFEIVDEDFCWSLQYNSVAIFCLKVSSSVMMLPQMILNDVDGSKQPMPYVRLCYVFS